MSGNVVDAMTARLLRDAGIGPGTSVLDIGCGRGDVSLMIAALVGPEGRVVGVDRDPRPLDAARHRVRELGFANVEFEEGDFGTPPSGEALCDAAVGRRVLMYQPDPVAAVRRLAGVVRHGGAIVFQEHDMSPVAGGQPSLPLHERAHGWIRETVEREGANTRIGFALAAIMHEAGLEVVDLRAEAILQTPGIAYPVGTIVRAVLPRIVDQGVASAGEIDVDTLDDRLRAERRQGGATHLWELVFGVIARKPDERVSR